MLYRDGPRSLLLSMRWRGDEGALPMASSGLLFWLELVVNPYVRLLRLAIAAADPSTCVAVRRLPAPRRAGASEAGGDPARARPLARRYVGALLVARAGVDAALVFRRYALCVRAEISPTAEVRARVSEMYISARASHAPVSYTHLTLPTKRIV